MSLSPEQVQGIAQLARLAIDDAEVAANARNLSRILDFVAALDRADVTGVTPMAHPLDMPQRRRPDEVTEADQRERAQANAPTTEAGLYVVPKVIE